MLESVLGHLPYELPQLPAEVYVKLLPLFKLHCLNAELVVNFVVKGGVDIVGEEEELIVQGSDADVLVEYSDSFLKYFFNQRGIIELSCLYHAAY